jgi:hypothetical protein
MVGMRCSQGPSAHGVTLDFVIIEIEVDGWILIDTEGASTSPLTPVQGPSGPGRIGAGGNSWWSYYTGRTDPDSTTLGRVDPAGPPAEIGKGLSSPAKSTEVVRDTDSVNSSLFSTVLRPFGRGKVPTDGFVGTATHGDTQESARPRKTQAELIKEEALARQSPSIVPTLPSPVLNTTTKSSWVSYFSSNASRSAPTMSDGRAIKQRAEHAGEMEVMNIDEDEMNEPIQVQTDGPARKPTTKPAPPLTDSPSVKHKASVISQGKKSSASSSAKESFPNLVLPTFGDTFYTVPRCMPPRTASAARVAPGSWKLKRTVKNISTMLFNTGASDKALGPNVANAEMEEYQRQAAERHRLSSRANFAIVEPAVARTGPGRTRTSSSFGSLAIDDFGHELPRVFSVLGHGNALGDIVGPIRAVVIGVHGCVVSSDHFAVKTDLLFDCRWFPGKFIALVPAAGTDECRSPCALCIWRADWHLGQVCDNGSRCGAAIRGEARGRVGECYPNAIRGRRDD